MQTGSGGRKVRILTDQRCTHTGKIMYWRFYAYTTGTIYLQVGTTYFIHDNCSNYDSIHRLSAFKPVLVAYRLMLLSQLSQNPGLAKPCWFLHMFVTM